MQSAHHSTCCSIETIMLLSTDGLPGPVIRKRLGKPAVWMPRYVRGPSAHFSAQRQAAAAADVDVEHGAGHGIEAGGEHDAHRARSRLSETRTPHGVISSIGVRLRSTSVDVVAVIGLEVVGVDAQPLRPERIVASGQSMLGDLGIVHDRADLLVHEAGGKLVRLPAR